MHNFLKYIFAFRTILNIKKNAYVFQTNLFSSTFIVYRSKSLQSLNPGFIKKYLDFPVFFLNIEIAQISNSIF